MTTSGTRDVPELTTDPCFRRVVDAPVDACADRLELPFELRQRVRQRVTLVSGQPAVLMLPRGTILRGGDVIEDPAGVRVAVTAAPEPVSTLRVDDARLLTRIAYHLGNRHLWVEVGTGFVRWQQDAVIDRMVIGLGGDPISETAPFEPEAGAYGGSHGHDHVHTHSHDDDHHHGHDAPGDHT